MGFSVLHNFEEVGCDAATWTMVPPSQEIWIRALGYDYTPNVCKQLCWSRVTEATCRETGIYSARFPDVLDRGHAAIVGMFDSRARWVPLEFLLISR